MVKERLLHFQKKTGKVPSNILMFRDGVSQSQYPLLLQKSDGTYVTPPPKDDFDLSPNKKTTVKAKDGEVVAIQDAYKEVLVELRKDKKEPKITFVVVGKRHNSRFFPTHTSQEDCKTGNVRPGATIQSMCTLPNEWPVIDNFFLQSHQVIQGTGRTAHYVVLKDDMNIACRPTAKGSTALHDIVSCSSTRLTFCHALIFDHRLTLSAMPILAPQKASPTAPQPTTPTDSALAARTTSSASSRPCRHAHGGVLCRSPRLLIRTLSHRSSSTTASAATLRSLRSGWARTRPAKIRRAGTRGILCWMTECSGSDCGFACFALVALVLIARFQ